MLKKILINTLIKVLLFLPFTVALAENHTLNIELFASNNAAQLTLKEAYHRLNSNAQHDLQNNLIEILQRNHVEQGWLVNNLGVYTSMNNQQTTADNVAVFTASPYQHLSNKQVTQLAQDLAITLKQESVAVFVPGPGTVAAISVTFTSHQPTIDELETLLHDKLPPLYSQAYSIYLSNMRHNLKHTTVTEIEWLGSKLSINEVRAAFPYDTINIKYGEAFLIYQNGVKENL